MKPKMTAAQLKRVSKQGSPLPIRHMLAAMPQVHQQDCEEKRDPDEYKAHMKKEGK
jgi:hypothetical protein